MGEQNRYKSRTSGNAGSMRESILPVFRQVEKSTNSKQQFVRFAL